MPNRTRFELLVAQYLWSRLQHAERISRVHRLHFFFRYLPGALISRYFSHESFFLKLLAYRSITQLQRRLLLKERPRTIDFRDDPEFTQTYLAAERSNSFSELARQEIETSRLSPNQLERLGHVYLSSGASDAGINALELARTMRRQSQNVDMQARVALLSEHWTGALGHLLNIERFQQLCQLGELPYDHVIILSQQFPIANRAFLMRLSESTRNLNLIQVNSHRIVRQALEAFAIHPSLLRDRRGTLLDHYALWDRAAWMAYENGTTSKRLISEKIQHYGDTALEKWGVGKDDEIVCLHVRSGSYGAGRGLPNANPLTYIPAIKKILDGGRHVIRMGDPSMPKLPIMKGLIDLAHAKEKTPWLDLYLWSRAYFAIGTGSGGSEAFPLFGVPTIFTNMTGIARYPFAARSFILPKLFKRTRSKVPMPFTEFVPTPFGISDAVRHAGYEDFEVIDNTAEDIVAAVDEMENLLSSRGKMIPETTAQTLLMELRQSLSRPERSVLSRSFVDRHPYINA